MTPTPAQIEAAENTGENTDRELWRGPDEGNGSFYADSIFVTKDGGIGINCGGYVVVMPIRKWFALTAAAEVGARVPLSQIMLDEVRAEERERCAQVADGYPKLLMASAGSSLDSACRGIAAAIRALKDKP